jgi:hypothetical protein
MDSHKAENNREGCASGGMLQINVITISQREESTQIAEIFEAMPITVID